MRKITLFTLLLLIASAIGNAAYGQYQLSNGDFENWSGSETSVPAGWHTFSDASGSFAWAASNHHKRVTGHSGSYACCLYPKKIMGVTANGNFTTGRMNAGSISASDISGNYNYSDISGGYCHSFTGYPDSIRFWASFYATGSGSYQGGSAKARLSAIIHDNYSMHDPINENSKVVAFAEKAFNRTTSSSSNISTSWQYYSTAFDYVTYQSYNQTSKYILLTFTTNEEAGKGSTNDLLYIDDIELVYNGLLTDIKLDGTTISGFNKNTYEYTANCCPNNIPTVTATAESSIANTKNQVAITQASASNNYTATINRLGSDIVYTIHFVSPEIPISLSNNGTYSACAGEDITVTASGATTYTWSNGQTGATIHPTASGQYTVTGTDANGCTGVNVAYVTVNEKPSINISGATAICSGAATTLTATGGSTYAWSNGASTNSINISTAGTYTVTVTNSAGCSDSKSITITANENPTITISGNDYLCNGSTGEITASGATSYLWSNGSTDATLNITTGGNYSVTGTDANGCQGSANKNVENRTSPEISIWGNTVLCEGKTTALAALSNMTGTTFIWNNGTEGSALEISEGGTYTVTGTLNGCSANAEHTVTSAAQPAMPQATGNSRCSAGEITLTATSADGTICNWYATETSQEVVASGATYSPTVQNTTTYYVSAQNEAGCSSERVTVSATVLQVPSTPTVANNSYCGEGDYTLSATSANSVIWYSDENGTSEINANQHIANTTTFYAAATDGNCQSALVPCSITINAIPQSPAVTTPEPVCSNDAVNVQLNATAGNGGDNVRWYNNANTYLSQGNSYQAKNISQSTVYYASSYNNTTHCESEKTPVNITINSLPDVPVLSCQPVCNGETATITANASGNSVKWYSANDELIGTGNSYSSTIAIATVFKASATDETTNCESAKAQITANVHPTYNINDTKSACEEYVWEGETYTQSGVYSKTLQSIYGCDSVVTLNLTINNGYNITKDTTVCDQLVWQGTSYISSQTITKTLQSINGCDSVVTINLTVNKSSQTAQTLTLCSNELPYEYAGINITSAGTKTITLTNAAGCDSIITLTVIVNPQPANPTITSNTTRCGAGTLILNVASGTNGNACRWYESETSESPFKTGNSYQNNFSENATYYVSSYNTNTGCESGKIAVEAVINAVPGIPQVENVARCGSGTVTLNATAGQNATTCRWFNNATITSALASGNTYLPNVSATRNYYVESYNESTQCKSSRVAVAVTVNAIPAVPQTTNMTNCGAIGLNLADAVTSSSPTYRWYNENENLLSEGSSFYATIHNTTTYLVSGYNSETSCESQKATLNVTIYPVYAPQNIYDTICQYSQYQQYGINQTFDEIGEKQIIVNYNSSHNCDSLVTLYLYVKPQITNNINKVECDQYVWNGVTYNQSGEYTQTFNAANGCDSIVTLNLTINNTVTNEFTAEACDEYLWNEQSYNQSGDYIQIFNAENGCDSVVTMHLTIHNAKTSSVNMEICEGELPIVYNETTFTADSQDFTTTIFNLKTVHGCDSTVTFNLTIRRNSELILSDEVCAGTRYNANGYDTTIYNTGTYTLIHNNQNTFGCDSTTKLTLTVYPTYNQSITRMICENGSYNFAGQTLTQAGEYVGNFQTVNGCDSIVTLTLNVGAEYRDTLTAHVCEGASFNQYGFNISNITETQFVVNNGIAANGCDSTTVLHLIVHQPVIKNINATTCVGSTYSDYNFTFTGSEVGEFEMTNNGFTQFGCDSTTILHITVIEPIITNISAAVCPGETYNQYGFDITAYESGEFTHTRTETSFIGCDSTINLHLEVYPVYNINKIVNTCQSNEKYYYEPTDRYFNVSEVGSYDTTFNFQTVNGCDSIINLTINVLQKYETEENVVLCSNSENLPYAFGDMMISQSGDYTYTFESQIGCDSVVTLHITINNIKDTIINHSICQGETYAENGFNILAEEVGAQQYTRVEQCVATGCDSTIILNLTVNPVYNIVYNESICEGEKFSNWGFDTTITIAGNYTIVHEYRTVSNCDSTLTLNLTVNPKSVVNHEVVLCQGETLNQFGFDTLITEVGTHTLIHQNINIFGCDSVTTLVLTINPTYTKDTIVNVCDVDVPYYWNDDELYGFDETGDYEIVFKTVNNCDSIVNLHLNVNPSYVRDTIVTVCQGALPYSFCNSFSFEQSGNYTVTLQTVNGCDSVWNLQLNVTPNTEYETSLTICDNELPFAYMGETFFEAGTYDIVETDADNCITITHFTLNVNSTYQGYDAATVCEENLPFVYGDSSFTQSGIYNVHYHTVAHCDSVITLTLTVIPTAHGTFEQTVCASDFPVEYAGQTFAQEGVYEITFNRENACDSIVTFTLVKANEYLLTENEETCEHELPYIWRNKSISQSGTYYDSLVSIHGCDSVYVLNLTVNETEIIANNDIQLCDGESATWRGKSLNAAGTYFDTTFNSVSGCYVIYKVDVIVNPTYLFHDSVTVCSDELPYVWREMNISTAGTHEVILQTAETYCDSIYRLTLTINHSYHLTETASVCDVELPYIWHGKSLTESGIYYDTLTTINGCDSTFTLTFTVNPTAYNLTTDTICISEVPYQWRGMNIIAAGIYHDSVPNTYGCIDRYELQLTINDISSVTLYDTICQGGEYVGFGFDTLTEQSGTMFLQQHLNNVSGCDSTVNLMLTVMPKYEFISNESTCENVPFEWRGGEYITAGTYYDSLVSQYGCDSVYVLNLTLNPTYDIFVSDSAMREHEYSYGDDFVITPADSGTFNYDIQYYTLANCDSIVHLTLYVAYNIGLNNITVPEFSFYPNPTNAMLNIKGERMRDVEVYSITGKLIYRSETETDENATIDVSTYPSGNYIIKVRLNDGTVVNGKIIVQRR